MVQRLQVAADSRSIILKPKKEVPLAE